LITNDWHGDYPSVVLFGNTNMIALIDH